MGYRATVNNYEKSLSDFWGSDQLIVSATLLTTKLHCLLFKYQAINIKPAAGCCSFPTSSVKSCWDVLQGNNRKQYPKMHFSIQILTVSDCYTNCQVGIYTQAPFIVPQCHHFFSRDYRILLNLCTTQVLMAAATTSMSNWEVELITSQLTKHIAS